MKLTIVAATGRIGRILVDRAVADGHEVTAVARRPVGFPAGVRTLAADLGAAAPRDLVTAIESADAVLSGLGPRKAAEAGIASAGTRTIVDAMDLTLVRRLVVVSAAPIGSMPSPDRPHPPADPGDGFFVRHLFNPMTKALLKRPFADLALMEDMLRASDLDWTAVRPPRLNDKPLSTTYRTAYGRSVRRGMLASRADVADLMLRLLGDPAASRQTVAIAN